MQVFCFLQSVGCCAERQSFATDLPLLSLLQVLLLTSALSQSA